MIWLVVGCEPEPASPTPTPPASADPEAVAPDDQRTLVGDVVTFDAGDSVGDTFTWTLSDGRVVHGHTVDVGFDAPGHLSVVLEAARDDGRADTAAFVVTAHFPALAEAPRSARAMDGDASRVFVPMRDFDRLAVVDRATGSVHHSPTCDGPRTVSATADAVWVACGADEIALHDLDGDLRVVWPMPRGSRPYGVVARGDGAWVTLGGRGAIARVGAAGVVDVVPVGPDVRGLAVVGDALFTSRWRSGDDGGTVFASDAALGPAVHWPLAIDPGPDSDTNTRGVPSLLSPVVVRPDGRVLGVGGLKSNVGRGEYVEGVPFTHDTTTRADLRLVSLVADEGPVGNELEGVVFDDRDQVIDLAWSPDGDWLYALHLGSEVVDVFDAYTLRRAGAAAPTGHGPDALWIDGDAMYVSAPLSRTLTELDRTRPEAPAPVRVIDLLPRSGEVQDHEVLRGEIVFTSSADGRMVSGGYMACATCHPEGDTDGRTWDFTQRGEGLRNTTSLLGGGGVAPLHWSANFDEVQDFENDIRGAFGGAGFLSDDDFAATQDPLGASKAGLSPELDALAAYLASLSTPPRSPFRDADGGPTDAALRGEAVFLDPSVGCATCHAPPAYTDSTFLAPTTPLLHDVGTLGPGSGERLGGPLLGLDTPTLRGVWATAPYLHDGSAPDLRAVLVDANPADTHGVTSGLSAGQLDDLISFLSSLE